MGLKGKENERTQKRNPAMLSLGSTVNNFAEQIGKQLGEAFEQEQKRENDRRRRERYSTQILNWVEIDLQEAAGIDLGERYTLQYFKRELHGKPVLRLSLIDTAKDSDFVYAFDIIPNLHADYGTISFGEVQRPAESINLDEEGIQYKAELRLRKSLRVYFDLIREYILHPRRAEEGLAAQNETTILPELDFIGEKLGTEEFFVPTLEIPDSNRAETEDVNPVSLEPAENE